MKITISGSDKAHLLTFYLFVHAHKFRFDVEFRVKIW